MRAPLLGRFQRSQLGRSIQVQTHATFYLECTGGTVHFQMRVQPERFNVGRLRFPRQRCLTREQGRNNCYGRGKWPGNMRKVSKNNRSQIIYDKANFSIGSLPNRQTLSSRGTTTATSSPPTSSGWRTTSRSLLWSWIRLSDLTQRQIKITHWQVWGRKIRTKILYFPMSF